MTHIDEKIEAQRKQQKDLLISGVSVILTSELIIYGHFNPLRHAIAVCEIIESASPNKERILLSKYLELKVNL